MVELEVVEDISHETVRRALKNELKPWRRVMRCVPPEEDAAFVAAMERVLGVCARPYDIARPVVCMDEQLVRESRETVPESPGRPERVDFEWLEHYKKKVLSSVKVRMASGL